MRSRLKVGDGVFITGTDTPAVVIDVKRDDDGNCLYLMRYGNLFMQRLEQHWFSIKVLSASTK